MFEWFSDHNNEKVDVKKSIKMAVSLAGVDFTAENVEQAVLQFYQSKATQVCLGCDSVNGSI